MPDSFALGLAQVCVPPFDFAQGKLAELVLSLSKDHVFDWRQACRYFMRMDKIEVKNIFAAVFEKRVLDPLLEVLDPKGVKFWGTEGTVKYLKSKGFVARSVVSGFDFDGRVKSLDRINFAAILADKSTPKHLEELKRLNMLAIDVVIVDLYKPDSKNFPETMDIGGQALIRAAVKNYKNVAVAFDKKSIFDLTLELNKNSGSTTLAFRKNQSFGALKFIASRCLLEFKMF